ncbi:unnamed protein product [Closterium sp. NIES-64]|nr:unnamed protein product [Closterium sp. NIES-64]
MRLEKILKSKGERATAAASGSERAGRKWGGGGKGRAQVGRWGKGPGASGEVGERAGRKWGGGGKGRAQWRRWRKVRAEWGKRVGRKEEGRVSEDFPMRLSFSTDWLRYVFAITSPVGMLALVIMCGGDGVADIVGRRCGSWKLPWNEQKSWAGSAAMLLCGFALSLM